LKIKAVSGIMLTLLTTGILTFAFNIEVHADRSLAPNGVRDMTAYENRIGEQGLLIEDENLQMWVPQRYETHSRIIFDYLVAGYSNLSSIFGSHEYSYRFSVEHYPLGSPHFWGGTDARGTIRYGYSNLEDNTPEWNLHGVPHVIGYYEEMAHCFVYDFGVIGDAWGGSFSVGFYETLGLMIGSETALRAAYNPYIETSISNYYQTSSETTSYYLQHNAGPPGVGNNIWPTRVMSHMFKIEVVDIYGWNAFTNTFSLLKQEEYPLKQYDRDHTWGGFLNYLGTQTSSGLYTIFADYGFPSLYWLEEGWYQKGLMRVDDAHYSFRVKCFDREGDQPSDVKLHVYSSPSSVYAMTFIGGNNVTGWIFEANVTLNGPTGYEYSFSLRDGAHSIFQGVGLPTLVHTLAPALSIYQGDLALTGNNVTVIEGRFDINGSIVVEENATLILRNAMLNFTQIERFRFGMTFQKSVNGYPRLIVKNATIITNNFQMKIKLYENSSAKVDALSTPISFDHHVTIELYDDSFLSMSNSTGGSIVSFQNSTATLTNSSMWGVMGYDNSNMTLSNSTLNSVGSSTRTLGGNVRVTAKNCTIITTTLVSSQLDLNLSISGLKPSFVNIWDFKTNSSAVGAEVPDLILEDTYVGGWSFTLHGKSNATISNSELFMQRTYDVSTWYLCGTKVEQLYAHGGWINTFDSIVNHVYALGSDAKIFAVNSTISYHFQPTGNSEILFSWYLEVHLIDSMGQDVPLANVVAIYSNGTAAGSKLTDADGMARLTLMEKMVNASGEYHVGNYTVEATLGPHSTDTSVNMTENKQITLTLEKPSTPFEALDELVQTVGSYNLDKGIERSLTSKLLAAYQSLDKENQNSAVGQLKAFVNHVEALQDKKLTFQQANQLISEATRIMDLI
jgi:hypothetical protein